MFDPVKRKRTLNRSKKKVRAKLSEINLERNLSKIFLSDRCYGFGSRFNEHACKVKKKKKLAHKIYTN